MILTLKIRSNQLREILTGGFSVTIKKDPLRTGCYITFDFTPEITVILVIKIRSNLQRLPHR